MKKVATVSDYLEYLSTLKTQNHLSRTVSCNTFFRGQANANWTLSPSLYRQGLFYSENLLITEMQHICPREFTGNRFHSLVKMQHFGMPTRLLDMTTNPLIALYFACESDEQTNEDGAVYIFPNLPVSWSTDPLVDLIMDFIYDYSPQRVQLDEMLNQEKKKTDNAVYRSMPEDINLLLHYLEIPAFAVMPAKTNERIEAQEGAFFVFGMHCQEPHISKNPGTFGKIYYDFKPIMVDDVQKIWHTTEKIIIPASAKIGILKQLDVLGINERKLFPDLPHQINYVVKSVKQNIMK